MAAAPPPALSARLQDAQLFAHRYVEERDAIRFIDLPRARHGEVPFLTDGYLGNPAPLDDIAADACLAALPDRPVHFIFHSAFCGSTMLARAFDAPGLAMGLSEPVLLNDLVGFRRRGAPPPQVVRLADLATRLLARPFGAGEQVVIKPSNVITSLAPLLMAVRPAARAVFLSAPLEVFLVSVAHKGLSCRLWARELLQGFRHEGLVDLGFSDSDLFRQSDLQIAATGWLVQHRLFKQAMARPDGGRIATLDSEAMLARPEAAIAAVAAHFGLRADAAQVRAMAQGSAFARHSKSGQPYSREARERDYAKVREAHADEIGKVAIWAREVARVNGFDLTPVRPLL